MNNKKIVITGAAGFIGSHLSEMFVRRGYDVIAFDRYNSFGEFGWLSNSKYKKNIEFVLGDIRDYDSVSKVLKKCRNVVHLAALIGIPYSYISPSAYLKTNIEGTLNILEACKNYNYERVIITSTSEIYGTAKTNNISELHQINAQSPYAASKAAADQLSLSYFRSYGTPIVIARPFNTYGPRQSLRAVIPTIISQLLNSKNLKIGNINSTRDLTYVSDTCEGFYKIFINKNSKINGEVINIGSNNEISVKKIISKIAKITNVNPKIIIEKQRVRPLLSEVERLKCNYNKLKKYTNWKPQINLDMGLKKMVNWMKDNKNNYSNEVNKYVI